MTKAIFYKLFLCGCCMINLQLRAQITFDDASSSLVNNTLTSGVSMGIADMNGDGLDDIVRLDNASDLQIEHQGIDGVWTAYIFGDLGSGLEWSMCISDVDRNGYNDIMAGGSYNNLKLLTANDNGNNYVASNLSGPNIFLQGSNFADIDNNGTIDFFACHDDGISSAYNNDGLGVFDYDLGLINAVSTIPSDNSGNYGSTWTDYDNDGDLDMYLSKCRLGVSNSMDGRRVNMLFQNDGSNNYTDVAQAAGLRPLAQSWASDFADIDNDGDLDVFIINHDIPNQLSVNNGDGTFSSIGGSGLTSVGLGIQCKFEDFDNDTYVDLLVTGRSGSHRLFWNNGDLTFTESDPFATGGLGIQSAAIGDLNNDGFVDVLAGFATAFNNPSANPDKLFMNNGNSNNYFNMQLEGVESNINGIGARVEVYGAWGKQIREVRAGESYGVFNSFTMHFGLGTANHIDSVIVRWPSGTLDKILTPDINSSYYLPEGTGCIFALDIPSLNDLIGECSIADPGIIPTASNGCSAAISGIPDAEFPISDQGITIITWTYDDGMGNILTQTQNAIINDTTPPDPDTPTLSDLTADCMVMALTPPTASDNCMGSINATHNALLPIITQGTTVITWIYEDEMGNVSSQLQNVIINDETPPVPAVSVLADITSACSVTTLPAPMASDNCADMINGTHDASLPIMGQGTTIITWTYDDGNGNTIMQNQNIVIADDVSPIPDVVDLPDVTSACSVETLLPPTANDNCSGTINGIHDASLPITDQGTTIIIWTYDDGHGNTMTQEQNIVIADDVSPVPDAANLPDITSVCLVETLLSPTASDNCSGVINGIHNTELPILTQGTTVITWTYDDGHGNMMTQNQNVVIEDEIPPVADIADLADIMSECEVTPQVPSGTDNCVGTINGVPDALFPIDVSTSITWTYDDGHGNIISQIQEVIITPINNSVTLVDDFTVMADASGYNYQWVDCDQGNLPLDDETNQIFMASENGNYAVEIDNGTCTVRSACVQLVLVNTEENNFESQLVIYPNPTHGSLTIELGATYADISLSISNVLGQHISNQVFSSASSIELNIDGPAGYYIVSILTQDGKSANVRIRKE